jgi:hypothetical protein
MHPSFRKRIVRSCYLIIVCCLVAWPQISGGDMTVSDQDAKPLNPDDVGIAPNAIRVPIGIFLLARKNQEHCAVKFTKFWTGKTQEDEFVTYESYYQGDRTGNFSNKNVKIKREKLSSPKPRGIGRLAFSFGDRDIKCGSIKLEWSGKGWVYFFNSNQKQGDYGIELAPTIWMDISEVDVFDPRIKWYRYDEERKRMNIQINKLWEGKKK